MCRKGWLCCLIHCHLIILYYVLFWPDIQTQIHWKPLKSNILQSQHVCLFTLTPPAPCQPDFIFSFSRCSCEKLQCATLSFTWTLETLSHVASWQTIWVKSRVNLLLGFQPKTITVGIIYYLLALDTWCWTWLIMYTNLLRINLHPDVQCRVIIIMALLIEIN